MNINKFLEPKDEIKKVEVMATIPVELRDAVNKKRNRMKLTWNELQEALFKAFLEDTKRGDK